MPANHQKPAPAPTPASPRNTSKYTNKDGSKFITVPKGAASDSSQPSTPTAAKASVQPESPAAGDASAPAVNRKKQKRRQKAAAKAAAEEAAANGHASPARRSGHSSNHVPTDHEIVVSDDEVEYVLGEEVDIPEANGHPPGQSSKKGKKKKKRNTGISTADDLPLRPTESDLHSHAPSLLSRGPGISRDKIWSTSNHEERERIKEFWLGLGEDERKSLVKVEKDAVLKKMKEQQKHTCSCTVCGRKRTAIEEELEGLYDSYYLELEQYANQGEGPPMLPPPRDLSPIPPPPRLRSGYVGQPPSRGRIVEHVGDDDDEEEIEEVYSEDEVEDDDYSDDEPPEEFHSPHDRDVADFLTFGNSLQVKGGILTVADDLLKNDGKRFIEMMEQLAERRMAREEDAREHSFRGYGHPNGSYSAPHNHNHPPPEDDYEDDEDEDDDYEEDSQDDEYEEEEETMTDQQRMEEGRRMFQIFAARMFEQRVLSAYKEKVAKERQQKLLEELEEESRQVDEQKAKKAKTAQKKKDKAAQKKQALAEEKARKDAEKAAEEAARLDAEQRRAAELKQKAEERRKQKEAQKKAEEDARLKKEADRLRRLHEQREKQAEQERKAREAKDHEKRLKEEQRLKERNAKEQKEREAQERKEKQERDKRDKEARAAKAQKEAQEAREAKEKAKEERAAQKAAPVPAPTQPAHPAKRAQHPVPVPTVLPQHPPNPANYASPKIPVATPAIPKAPTPMRSRTASQQHEAAPQPATQPSPKTLTPVSDSSSPGQVAQTQQRKVSGGSAVSLPPLSQSVSPGHSKGPGQGTPFHMSPLGMQPPPGLAHQPPPPGFPNRMSHDGMFPPGFRPGPNMMMPPPPGINGPAGRGFPPMPMPPPGFQGADQFGMGPAFPMPKDAPHPTHARQGSASFDGITAQPIGRPAPIGRPGSVLHGRHGDEDEDTKHLGSRALLDDDEPLTDDLMPGGIRIQPPGLRSGGMSGAFGSGSFGSGSFMDSAFAPGIGHNPWGPPTGGAHPFPPPGFGNPGWGAPLGPPGFAVGSPVNGLGSIRPPAQPRHVAVRLMLCQACKDLAGSAASDNDGYIDLANIKSRIESQSGDPTIMEQDLLNLCDTEGSPSNGGGTFDVRRDATGSGKHSVRWAPDPIDGLNPQFRAVGAPGEIGSPLMGHAAVRGT